MEPISILLSASNSDPISQMLIGRTQEALYWRVDADSVLLARFFPSSSPNYSPTHMKKSLLTLFIGMLLAISPSVFAQKYAYIDSQYILDNISEYKAAQQQLDQLSIAWQKEIESKYAVIDKLYKDYQAEQILLTEDMRRKREMEITSKEKEVKEFQKQKFGYEGELFKKKQELIKPIQDKIYNAVKKMATEQSYAVIFDKSGDLVMLYTNPKYDKSDDILSAMGYKAGNKNQAPDAAPGGATKLGAPEAAPSSDERK
jgi:outer membrane protein